VRKGSSRLWHLLIKPTPYSTALSTASSVGGSSRTADLGTSTSTLLKAGRIMLLFTLRASTISDSPPDPNGAPVSCVNSSHSTTRSAPKALAGTPAGERDKLELLAEQTRARHRQLKETVSSLQESINFVRLSIKYMLFDLEAARRLESGLSKRLPGNDALPLTPWELEDLEKMVEHLRNKSG